MKEKETILKFKEPLIMGIIENRKGQFIFNVKILDTNSDENNEIIPCHSPTTGRIGNLDVKGLLCLLSKNDNPKRKTKYTVEAVSLNKIADKKKTWIGINQNAANRYVEYFLKNGNFNKMLGKEKIPSVIRETVLGNSKLDFLVDNIYLEVKTPLQQLQIEIPEYIRLKKVTPFSSTDRFAKHIQELSESLKNHERAILLNCFIYDNPGFKVIEKSKNYEEVSKIVNKSLKSGVELWQVNFEITETGVEFKDNFKIKI